MASATLRSRPFALTGSALAFVLACGDPEQPQPTALKLEGPTMGTFYAVTVPGAGKRDEPAVNAAVRDELERVDALMSTYREDSELARFNRHESPDPFSLSEETFRVISVAQAVSESTAGAFDITVGPLVDAWGFGPSGATDPPSDAILDRLRRNTGWRKLTLNESERSASKQDPKLRCDLSAIAKGFAVDLVATALESLGFADFLVEVGGEIRAGGTNPESAPWRIGIERPDEFGRLAQRILHVSRTGVATSGDYRNFREVEGRQFAHVVDPRNGRPATSRVASATVLDPSAMRADALATAMLVLGEVEGLALAEREELAVYLIVRDGDGRFREVSSSSFRARMNHGSQ